MKKSKTGKKFYTNGVINKKFNPDEDIIPEGFYLGKTVDKEKEASRIEKIRQTSIKLWQMSGKKGTTAGKIVINKDGKDRYIYPDQISQYEQEGWSVGGKSRGPSKFDAWNKGLTKYDDERVMQIALKLMDSTLSQETKTKISDTVKKLWLDDDYRDRCVQGLIGKVPWNKGLTKQSCDKLVQSQETIEYRMSRMKDSILEKYGDMQTFFDKRAQTLKETHEDEYKHRKFLDKFNNTIIDKYGNKDDYYSNIVNKGNITKIKNNSFNKSSLEDDWYQYLISMFGEKDVYRQYKDNDRYPFYCDFYIPCQDLFIEINGHWTHGIKPFDANDKFCQQQLEKWQEKAKISEYYLIAIYVWTDLDVRKLEIAKNNNLNYRRFYFNDKIEL